MEWDAQTDAKRGIQPATMPLMKIFSTAIDQIQMVSPEQITASSSHSYLQGLPIELGESFSMTGRERTIHNCMQYLPTDLTLFYTSESDRILLSKQREHYKPILRWLKKEFSIELATTSDMVGKLNHPIDSVMKIREMLKNMVNIYLIRTIRVFLNAL